MKKLKQNDLFKHIDQFLKDKGIEIREAAPLGSRLRTGCQILTDTINNAQSTLGKAKDNMDEHLDKMRSIIHEKTAPKKAAKNTAKKKGGKPTAKKKAKAKTKANKPAQKKKVSTKKAAKNKAVPKRTPKPKAKKVKKVQKTTPKKARRATKKKVRKA